MKRLLLIALLLPGFSGVRAADLPVGSAALEAELLLENLQHKTQPGMSTSPDGVGKLWTYDPNSSAHTADRGDMGETFFLTASARPGEHLYGDAQFSVVGNYADAFWRPINDLHRQETSGERIRFRRGEASWVTPEARLRLLQGKAYEDWGAKGDIFRLVPRQYEVERYLNFSGHAVPRVVEGQWKSPWGEFGLITGPEPVWGAGRGTMARYGLMLGGTSLSFIFKDEDFPAGDPDERLRAYSASLSGPVAGLFSYDAGLLYQPFRLNRPFQRVESAAGGAGDFGSNYDVIDDISRRHDAWGMALRLRRPLPPVLDRGEIGYTLRRPVAGNLEESFVEGEKRVTPALSVLVRYAYRRPWIDALPLLYAGSPSNPGALLLNPRGPESPFWVFWRPEGAVADNREAHLLTFTAVHDPTPKTWIFKNDAYLIAPDNIADDEDALFAAAFQYSLEHYPGGTDRSLYHEKDGVLHWEPAYHTGNWPTRRPIHRGTVMLMSQGDEWASETFLQAGQSLALANAAYRSPTDGFKPVTNFFSAAQVFVWRDLRASASLGLNVWGPEEINQRFGQTFDRLLQLGLEYSLPWHNRVGLAFTRARETDQKYIAQDLGGFDEWRIFFSQKFSVLGKFRKGDGDVRPQRSLPAPVQPAQPAEEIEEAPQEAPQSAPAPAVVEEPLKADIRVDRDAFHPQGEPLMIRLWTSRPRQLTQWSVMIRPKGGASPVKSFAGFIVPEDLLWDGVASGGQPAAPGNYEIVFSISEGGRTAQSVVGVRLLSAESAPAKKAPVKTKRRQPLRRGR